MHAARTSLVVFSLFLAIPALAQQPTSTSNQGSALLQLALTALAPTPISDITLSGTTRHIAGSTDESGQITYRALATGQTRSDCSYPSGPAVEIRAFSGTTPAGIWSGPDGSPHAMSGHNLVNRADIFPLFTFALLLGSSNLQLSLIGQETKNGQSVYHLHVAQQFPQGSPESSALYQHLTAIEIFLDTATLLPAELDFTVHPDNDGSTDIPAAFLFSDYRLVAGVEIPFHVQKFLNSGLLLDLQFTSANANSGLTPADFNLQ